MEQNERKSNVVYERQGKKMVIIMLFKGRMYYPLEIYKMNCQIDSLFDQLSVILSFLFTC